MSAVEFSSLNKRDSVASISASFDFRQFTSTIKNTGNEFLGLSLPLDLSTLFQVSRTVILRLEYIERFALVLLYYAL